MRAKPPSRLCKFQPMRDARAALCAAAAHASHEARRRCFDLYGFRWRLLVDEHVTNAHQRGELSAEAFARCVRLFDQNRSTADLAAAIDKLKGTP